MHPYRRLAHPCIKACPNTQESQSGNGALSANKGHPQNSWAGHRWHACTFPLLPALGGAWITCLFDDAKALGIPHNSDYVIPMDPRAFTELGVEPAMATVARAEEHIRTALQMAGFSHAVWSKVQRQTAKRSGMRILNSVTGGIHVFKSQDKMFMAHHRVIGGHKRAGAYNPFHLVSPVKKAHFLWIEWLAMCQVEFPGSELPWKWARLKQQKGPTALRHHVLVYPKEREISEN